MTRRSAALAAPLPRPTAHILVVEDDEAIRALLHRLLREAGYTTIGCRAARDAQYLIATERPDLLLVDLHLLDARAGGWEVLSLAPIGPRHHGLADHCLLGRCGVPQRQAPGGADALGCWTIAKPFDIRLLLQAIATALDASAAMSQ